MQSRRLMLAALSGGIVLGMALGLTTQTELAASPAPAWQRHTPPVAGSGDADQRVEAGRQDLSLAWDPASRLPTWKRRQDLAMQRAAYVPIADGPATKPDPRDVQSGDDNRWRAVRSQIAAADARATSDAAPGSETAMPLTPTAHEPASDADTGGTTL